MAPSSTNGHGQMGSGGGHQGQGDVRRTRRIVEYALGRDEPVVIAAIQILAEFIEVALEGWEVAARDLDPNAVPLGKADRRAADTEIILVDLTRLDGAGLFAAFAVARALDGIDDIDCPPV